jgi:hypothetical protein
MLLREVESYGQPVPRSCQHDDGVHPRRHATSRPDHQPGSRNAEQRRQNDGAGKQGSESPHHHGSVVAVKSADARWSRDDLAVAGDGPKGLEPAEPTPRLIGIGTSDSLSRLRCPGSSIQRLDRQDFAPSSYDTQ